MGNPRIKEEPQSSQFDGNQFINKPLKIDEKDCTSCQEDSVLSICPQCNFSTSSMHSLDAHMEEEHGDPSIDLSHGNNRKDASPQFSLTKMPSDISLHNDKQVRQISDSRRRYRCNICPVTFPWHGDLAAHLSDVHGFQKASRDGSKSKAGSYKCSFCMYVAKYQSELKRHRRLHMGVKPFGCVFCKYRSAWKGDLKRHIESHHRGNFSSEEELASIMSQYKNNAGTEIKDIRDDEIDSIPNHMNSIRSNDSMASDNQEDSSKESTTDSTHTRFANYPLTTNLQFEAKTVKPSPPVENGLNLTMPNKNNISENQSNPVPTDVYAQTKPPISNNSIIGSMIKTPTNASCIQDVPFPDGFPYFQGINNEIFNPIAPPTNSFSFNDLVARMLATMNGILPTPSFTTPITLTSNPQVPPIFSNAEFLKNSIMNMPLMAPQNPASYRPPPTTTEFDYSMPPKSNILEFKPMDNVINTVKSESKLKDNTLNQSTSHQEHWKRFKCSACGHRSNWKWDINKHIKVAHPERDGITTVELSYDEAKATLQSYLNSTKANKSRSHNSFDSEEGYYRPYKCSACGHRSNWKWDVNKHIKQVHQRQAEVITLSMEEAKKTICQYKRRRRTNGLGGLLECDSVNTCSPETSLTNVIDNNELMSVEQINVVSPKESVSTVQSFSEKEKSEVIFETNNSEPPTLSLPNVPVPNPRIDTLRLKRLKCNGCGYRSNYRSDISRHIRRKHDSKASIIFLSDVPTPIDNPPDPSGRAVDPGQSVSEIVETDESSPFINDSFGANQQRKLWQCNLCDFNHREKIQVSQHITRSHHPERPFSCKLCLYGTDYRNSLLRHLKAKHKSTLVLEALHQNLSKVKLPMNLCGNLDLKKEEEEQQQQQQDSNPSKTAFCTRCKQALPSYQELLQHTALEHTTSDEDMYLIFKPKSFIEKQIQHSHINFFCSNCPFTTTSSDAAEIHQFQHTDLCQYRFKCTKCSYRASRENFLMTHLIAHRNGDTQKMEDMPEDLSCRKVVSPKTAIMQLDPNDSLDSWKRIREKQVLTFFTVKKCSRCSFKTSNSNHLKVHYTRYHYKRMIFKIKKRSYSSNNSFAQLNEESFSFYKNYNKNRESSWCDECGFLANDENQLKRHLMKHVNNNNSIYQCSLCTYNSDSEIDLKSHEMIHVLGEGSGFSDRSALNQANCKLICDKCNFTTNMAEKLDLHKYFHYPSSDSAIFCCFKCNFHHPKLFGLIKHLKCHH